MREREKYDGLSDELIKLQDDNIPYSRIERVSLIAAGICVLCALYLMVGLYI